MGALACACPGLAQDSATDQPAFAPALAGPIVPASPGEIGLVEYDFNGKLRRLDVPPEEAALALLDLPREVRARIDAIILDRRRAIESIVTEQTDLLVQLNTAGSTGNKADQLMLGLRLLGELREATGGQTVRRRVRDALPKDLGDRFDALVGAYWRAVSHEQETRPGDVSPLWRSLTEESLRVLGLELERAFQSALSSGRLVVDVLLRGIDLSPEQEEAIKRITTDFSASAQPGADEKAYIPLVVGILAHLTGPQRKIVMERLRAL